MTIICPKCKTRLTLPDEKLKPEGTRFRCSKCHATLFYKDKREAPQGDSQDSETVSAPPDRQPLTSSLSAVSGAKVQQSHDFSPSEQTGNFVLSDATAESRGTDEKLEMLKKMGSTPGISEQIPLSAKTDRKIDPRRAAVAGAAGILIVAIIGLFFFYSKEDDSKRDVMRAPVGDKGMGMSPPSVQGKYALPQAPPTGASPVESPQDTSISEGPMTEEKAIEIVKRSEALLTRTSVDSIVMKWTEENAAKYKMVGWQAKKIDEQKYLVSYTALDGDVPRGFYFELDAQSGVVKDFSKNPELQKKYNIR